MSASRRAPALAAGAAALVALVVLLVAHARGAGGSGVRAGVDMPVPAVAAPARGHAAGVDAAEASPSAVPAARAASTSGTPAPSASVATSPSQSSPPTSQSQSQSPARVPLPSQSQSQSPQPSQSQSPPMTPVGATASASTPPAPEVHSTLPGYGDGWERSPASFGGDDGEYIRYLEAMTDEGVHGIDRLADATWAKFRLRPLGFSRSMHYMTTHPAASAADAIAPDALAALGATKARTWAALIPGDASTYVYAREPEYLTAYAQSWLAHTWRKAGWDCNRHVEILATGAIPVFRGAAGLDAGLMGAYPIALLRHIEAHHDGADVKTMALWRHFLLRWTHAHLSSVAMARYMARATGVDLDAPYAAAFAPPPGSRAFDAAARLDAAGDTTGTPTAAAGGGAPAPLLSRVAFIDADLPAQGDYLAIHVLLGLTEWLGPGRVDVFYPPGYMYARDGATDEERAAEVGYDEAAWAHGFGYAHVLPPRGAEEAARTAPTPAMLDRLATGRYAAVVWGSAKRSAQHLADAIGPGRPYEGAPHRVWLCDGEDEHDYWAVRSGLARNASVFVRELLLNGFVP
jgi:hypothetical protein